MSTVRWNEALEGSSFSLDPYTIAWLVTGWIRSTAREQGTTAMHLAPHRSTFEHAFKKDGRRGGVRPAISPSACWRPKRGPWCCYHQPRPIARKIRNGGCLPCLAMLSAEPWLGRGGRGRGRGSGRGRCWRCWTSWTTPDNRILHLLVFFFLLGGRFLCANSPPIKRRSAKPPIQLLWCLMPGIFLVFLLRLRLLLPLLCHCLHSNPIN